MIDVQDWLREHGFEQYAELFVEHEIDGDVLFELTNDDLKDLGLSLGARKKLLKAIATGGADKNQPASGSIAPADTTGERRQVTVLFADIAGYTKLSSKLGAEATHTLLNQYFAAVDGIVEGYGGSID